MDLRHCLQDHLKRCHFISITDIGTLINQETVREIVRSHGLVVENDMVEYITFASPRIFAILVLIEGVHHIRDFLDNGLNDDKLPLEEASIPDFENNDGKLKFISIQRKFPPVFEKQKHLELPYDTVLPFIERTFLDNGSFGMVEKVKVAEGHLPEPPTNIAALKQRPKGYNESWDEIMREVDTLRNREHPNIISLLASFTLYGIESGFEKKSLNMLFQYAEMNMESWMSLEHTPQHLQSMDQAGRRKYLYNSMYQLVSALSFLHRELDGMITAHHDLKPKNILLLGDTLKIGDLGGSQLIPPAQGSETDGPKGTFTYHPPEYWNDDGSRASRRHGRSFDMWSMGCILTEMATLVVYGWEQQQVRTYRERRSKAPQQRKLKRQSNEHQEDDSFHNHMNEVYAWIQQLEDTDGSRVLIESLDIAQGMLKSNPKDRLYSWEAELDLFELLHPDNPRVVRLEKGALCVQPPGKGALSGVHTPIHRAKLRGNQDRVNQLLQKGWSAGVHHHPLEVSPLTETRQGKGSVNYDTLARGQGKRNLDMVSQLGGNPQKPYANELSDFANAVKHKSSSETLSILAGSSSLQELLREEDDDALTVLHWTARFGSYTTMDYLLHHLIDKSMFDAKDSFGKTALHHASEKASTQVMQLLLGAYPQESREDWILTKDSNGKTPLHWAAQGGNTSAASLLLDCASTPSAILAVEDDGGNTPLLLAIKHASSEVENLLLNWCK